LPLGNGAFEIAVIERMILHFDREPLVMGIERRALRHRPGLEDTVELEPQIVMQPARIMLLDHEPPLLRGRNRCVATGFGGLLEIPLLSIGGQVSQGHDSILQLEWHRLARRPAPGTKTPSGS
jgi:hypothetical protein